MGALIASQKQFPQIRPGTPWKHRPAPGSDADVDQAIAAKVHLGLRLQPILATAQLVIVERDYVQALPDWPSPDDAAIYAEQARLLRSPIFLDFENVDGMPAAWAASTWPLPFHLRGALCWAGVDMLNIVPYGSVGGQHPWGGTDYQAWARWIYLREGISEWPEPGPGDFIGRASGELRAWVDAEDESVCSQQGRVTHNLGRRVLAALALLESIGELVADPALSRQVRRRAERDGHGIALVPKGMVAPRRPSFPRIASSPDPAASQSYSKAQAGGPERKPCPIPKTHARLDQSHVLWHEALDAYSEPDKFVARLNALIQSLRSVTFVLQKELRHNDRFAEWYENWQTRMRNDARMVWLVTARNMVEKEGDLDTSSVARVRVTGDWPSASVVDIDVDPTTLPHDIARRINVPGLPERVQREGTLVVERRWTVEDFADDELLDVLAHCFGFLATLVADCHQHNQVSFDDCFLSADNPCETNILPTQSGGRPSCMFASRESRTARRNLSSGALIQLDVRPPNYEIDEAAALERYGPMSRFHELQPQADLLEQARLLHEWGKHLLLTDGHHVTIAWLVREGEHLAQLTLFPEDQREKFLMIEHLAAEVERVGADAVIYSAEIWEVAAVPASDPRVELRPEERDDRREAFVTLVLGMDGSCTELKSSMSRVGEGLRLGDAREAEAAPPPFLRPLLHAWQGAP